ncbi:MAG: hypothetical protein ACPGNT_07430 [Rhodospirillales bacterium]
MVKYGAVVLALWVAGCTSAPIDWQKPGVEEEEAQSTYRSCRRWASREVERDHVLRSETGGGGTFDRTSGYRDLMATYDAGQSREELIADCMRRLGYRAAESKE